MGRKAFVAEEICKAAFDLFAREGYEAVSTRDIARQAGVGSASMYRHFPTKEDLGRMVYKRALSPLLDEMAQIVHSTQTERERLRSLVVLLYDSYDRRPKALALLCFPPHEFIPEELAVDNPRSARPHCLPVWSRQRSCECTLGRYDRSYYRSFYINEQVKC